MDIPVLAVKHFSTLSPLDILMLITCLLLFAGIYLRAKLAKQPGLPYPPGPRPLPLLENLLDVPRLRPWLTYTEWAKKYGDLMHIRVFGMHIIIIHTMEIANELFEKRSQIYSSRPGIPMADLLGCHFFTGFLPYGNRWRAHRRLLKDKFGAHRVHEIRPMQLTHLHRLLKDCLENPEEFDTHLRRLAGANVMGVMYGYQISPRDDPFIAVAQKSADVVIESTLPGAYLVNIFPSLLRLPEWCPGAGFKAHARHGKQTIENMINLPFEWTKKSVAAGTAVPSFTSEMLERNASGSGSVEDEKLIKDVAASAFLAGIDSISGNISIFILAMILHPACQARGQAEIDRVVGRDRLPNFDDRERLPFVEAILREIMRWRPSGPLSIPHCTTKDDVYNGYFIPAGAVVMGNIWAITHDEANYADPYSFKPERYFLPDGTLNNDTNVLTFGFGRRICAARHMADETVWLAIASFLAVFNLTKAKDDVGRDIEVDANAFTGDGVVSIPLPYQCSITPRSREAVELVIAAVESKL